MGKPCVCGCTTLVIDLQDGIIMASGQTLKEGDSISIDGSTGEVFFCRLNTSPSEILQVLLTKDLQPDESQVYQYYDQIMALADKYVSCEYALTPIRAMMASLLGHLEAKGLGFVAQSICFWKTSAF